MRSWLKRLRRYVTSGDPNPLVPMGALQARPSTSSAPRVENVRDSAIALLSGLRHSDTSTYSETQETILVLEHLRDRLEEVLDVEPNRFSILHASAALHFLRHCVASHGLPLQGATHLEFGCGGQAPYGRMFTHLLLGVERAVCVDSDAIQEPDRAVRHVARLMAAALIDPSRVFPAFEISREQLLANGHDLDLSRLARGDATGFGDRLRFLQGPIQRSGLPSSTFDATFSNSVLEHLDDLDTMMAELRRITRPGGFGVHGIDVSDHSRYYIPGKHPLEFLCEDPAVPFVHECNRLRLVDFEAMFARHGFTIVEAWRDPPEPVPPEVRRRLADPWRRLDDSELGVYWAQYLIRRD